MKLILRLLVPIGMLLVFLAGCDNGNNSQRSTGSPERVVSIQLDVKKKGVKKLAKPGKGWTKAIAEIDNYKDTVKVERTDIGYSIKFKKTNFYNRNYRLNLIKVGPQEMRRIAMYELAALMGCKAPDIRAMEIQINDKEAESVLGEQIIDKAYIETQGVSSSFVFVSGLQPETNGLNKIVCKDSYTVELVKSKINLLNEFVLNGNFYFGRTLFDYKEMARYVILKTIDGTGINGEHQFYYCHTNGKIFPLYRYEKDGTTSTSNAGPFVTLLEDSAFISTLLDEAGRMKMNLREIEEAIINKQKQFTTHLVDESAEQKVENICTSLINKVANYQPKLESIKLKQIDELSTQMYRIESPVYGKMKDHILTSALDQIEYITSKYEIEFENKLITFKSGKNYLIDERTIIPAGYTVVIEAGTKILLEPRMSLLSYSPFMINGTKEQPVIVTANKPDQPFGTFAFVGSGKDKCNINWLNISGGSEDRIHGLYLSGAFCLYHTDVDLNDCVISNNKADDGLNIKFGKVNLTRCIFEKNYADQVDLDFCTGVVTGCSFNNNKGDSNGDGLDFSGSSVIVYNSSFNKFDDKGMSIGEESNISVTSCIFSDNKLGMAIKDLSVVKMDSCTFKGNKLVISLYRKKQMFGGGTLIEGKGNYYENNKNKFETDNLSKVES